MNVLSKSGVILLLSILLLLFVVYLFLIMNVRHAETYILWQDLIWFHVSFFFPFLFHFIFCALFSPSNAYTYWQCYSTIYLINRNINNVECISVVCVIIYNITKWKAKWRHEYSYLLWRHNGLFMPVSLMSGINVRQVGFFLRFLSQ